MCYLQRPPGTLPAPEDDPHYQLGRAEALLEMLTERFEPSVDEFGSDQITLVITQSLAAGVREFLRDQDIRRERRACTSAQSQPIDGAMPFTDAAALADEAVLY